MEMNHGRTGEEEAGKKVIVGHLCYQGVKGNWNSTMEGLGTLQGETEEREINDA